MSLPSGPVPLRADPRFTWRLYAPEGFEGASDRYRLVIAVHGSGRGVERLLDGFAPHADRNRWVVLAPHFPPGVLGNDDGDGYKTLIEGDIRYDRLLLAMVEEAEQALNARFDRFGLYGFSGGGQFAHRFLYRHPDRLWAVSIGAPGAITRIDDRFDYWFGTRNLAAVLGAPLDLDAVRKVPIQLVCGDQDLAEPPIPAKLAERLKPLGDIGRHRVDRIGMLAANYREHGLDVRLDMVPGVAHEGVRCIDTGAGFLAAVSHGRSARS